MNSSHLSKPLNILIFQWRSAASSQLALGLTHEGHQVIVVDDAAKAVDAVSAHHYDGIIAGSEVAEPDLIELRSFVEAIDNGRDITQATILFVVVNSADAPTADGFLPLAEFAKVNDLLNRFSALATITAPMPVKPSFNDLPLFEEENFRMQMGNDPEMIHEIVDLFLRESAEQIASMRKALENRDSDQLSRLAHSIKGSLGSLQAPQPRALAQQIESSSSAADLSTAAAVFESLAAKIQEMEPRLRSLLTLS